MVTPLGAGDAGSKWQVPSNTHFWVGVRCEGSCFMLGGG